MKGTRVVHFSIGPREVANANPQLQSGQMPIDDTFAIPSYAGLDEGHDDDRSNDRGRSLNGGRHGPRRLTRHVRHAAGARICSRAPRPGHASPGGPIRGAGQTRTSRTALRPNAVQLARGSKLFRLLGKVRPAGADVWIQTEKMTKSRLASRRASCHLFGGPFTRPDGNRPQRRTASAADSRHRQ